MHLRARTGHLGLAAFLPAILVAAWAIAAPAADISVFSAGAIEPGLLALADAFQGETGHRLRFTVGVPAELRRRVEAGERPDVLVVPTPILDELVRSGRIVADGRVVVGKVGVGVTVREGAPVPDVSSVDALRKALHAAESLVYNRASTGVYFERLVERLGLAAELAAKTTRYPDGVSVLEHVLRGHGREIGIGAITEIRQFEPRGLRLVGPLPPDVQNYTTYAAGMLTASSSSDGAATFLRFVSAPAARAAFQVTGVE
jgi:molybdate transport system substrate-binding protein